MDGQTDELIWGGLGNLRFLQVKFHIKKKTQNKKTGPTDSINNS